MSKLVKADTFPNFDNSFLYPNQGLIELNSPSIKEVTDNHITNFRNRIRNQPPFFISRDSWRQLVNGIIQTERGEECWLPKGYEVFAFVFCLAFDKQGYAYFRIRTIIIETSKRKGEVDIRENNKPKTIEALIETDNIATVNIDYALSNVRARVYGTQLDLSQFITVHEQGVQSPFRKKKETKKPKNCLVFPNTDDEKVKINGEVVRKDKLGLLPSVFKDPNNKINLQHLNEGSLFSKQKIWDDILLSKYPFSQGTLISLARVVRRI